MIKKIKQIIKKNKYIRKRIILDSFELKHGGNKNKTKKFLLIKDSHPSVGILSGWSHYMTLVNFALNNNLIPVLDFTNNYMPLFMDNDYDGKTNYWDYYFTQPQKKYSLDDIYQSRNYYCVDYCKIMPKMGHYLIEYSLYKNSNNDFIKEMNPKDTLLCRQFYLKCHLSNEIQDQGNLFCKEHEFDKKKILGVSFRRTFEKHHILKSEITPEGTHPVKATLSQLLLDVENTLKENNFDYIFFTTDDRESLEKMKEKFGKKCLYTSRRVQHLFEDGKIIVKNTTEETLKAIYTEFKGIKDPVKTRNIEYLTDVYILSKCNSLLARGGSADVFAYIINDDKYEHIYE